MRIDVYQMHAREHERGERPAAHDVEGLPYCHEFPSQCKTPE